MSFTINEPTPTEVTPDVPATVSVPDSNLPSDAGTVPPVDNGVVAENSGAEAAGAVPPTDEGTPPAETPPPEPSEISYYFGGEQVEVEIAQDVTDALKEHGLDAAAVAAELYANEGDFKLSEDTMGKLYAAFGKFSVDAYLSGLKSQNEMFSMREANSAREMEAANTQRFTDISKECGGDAGWAALEAFALEHISDDELAAFNGVMESGNAFLQAYAVRELEGRRKAMMGDAKADLIEPTGSAAAQQENGPLNAADYQKELMKIGSTYGRDKRGAAEAQARLDARRRAGMAAGL